MSCPEPRCHDNGDHKGRFAFSGLGTSQVQSLPSPYGYGHNTQIPCRHVVGDGTHAMGVIEVGLASLLLCHTSTVEHLDLRGKTLEGLQSYG